jgi:hypothetical protein
MLLPDTSEFQPNTDFSGIKKQNGGAAIIRAAYGAVHKDHVFDSHRVAAHGAGFHFVGLYQYLTAFQDVNAQATAFVHWVGKLQPGEIPMLDLEEGTGNQFSRADVWFSIVDEQLGLSHLPLNKRSWIYSYTSFVTNHTLLPIFQSARRSWIAEYDSTEPTIPHSLWQSTDGVQGANRTSWAGAGSCDTSYTKYTLADLAAMAYQPVAVPVAPIGLSATRHGATANLSWHPVSPAPDYYRYQVYHFNGSKQGTLVAQDNVAGTHVMGLSISGDSTLIFRVQARGGHWSTFYRF